MVIGIYSVYLLGIFSGADGAALVDGDIPIPLEHIYNIGRKRLGWAYYNNIIYMCIEANYYLLL